MVTRLLLPISLALALACAGGAPEVAAGPQSTLLQADDVVVVTRRSLHDGTIVPHGQVMWCVVERVAMNSHPDEMMKSGHVTDASPPVRDTTCEPDSLETVTLREEMVRVMSN